MDGVYSGLGIRINNQIAGMFLKNAGFYTGKDSASASLRILIDKNKAKTEIANAGIEMVEENQGFLSKIKDKIGDMADLASQAAAGGLTGSELSDLQEQFVTLKLEVDELAQGDARKTSLLKSDGQESVAISTTLTVEIDKRDMTSSGLGLEYVDLTSDAQAGVDAINAAISDVDNFEVHLEMKMDTLEAATSALDLQNMSLTAAKSGVESMNAALMVVGAMGTMSNSNVELFLAAQANVTSEIVLSLLAD